MEIPKLNAEQMRADLLPAEALLEVSRVMAEGELKYGAGEVWRQQCWEFHYNRAMIHIFKFKAGYSDEDHLAHAVTRLLMAQELI